MKKILLLLISFISVYAYGKVNVYEKLAEVNKCWREQKDVSPNQLPQYGTLSEHEWIRTHLLLVKDILGNRSTLGLSEAQQRNRRHCIELLESYAHAGNFPVNEDYTYRTPIFIDKHDNFCAVGYLLKATGYEAVSRMISSGTNLAYVRSMQYPELATWAHDYGFTADELAWIQPAYPPKAACASIGNGVDGEVKALYTDNSTSRLYVGGKFTDVDGSITANNIAYVTEAGGVYTWHNMGNGVDGTVNAILPFDGKLFLGGKIFMLGGMGYENVVYWDGSMWRMTGMLGGVVNDLAVYNGELYAAGCFFCDGMPGNNFAKMTGTGTWEQIPGLDGYVNTIEVHDGKLVLGGSFTYGSGAANMIRWNGSTFQPYATAVSNEVKDLMVFQDTLHAVCKKTHATDTTSLFLKMRNNNWIDAFPYAHLIYDFRTMFGDSTNELAFNTLCSDGTNLNIGGHFSYMPMLGFNGNNTYSVGTNGFWMDVDNAVNKMVMFNGELIIGGRFHYGNGSSAWGDKTLLNGIARRKDAATVSVGAPDVHSAFTAFPNPVSAEEILTLNSSFSASHYHLQHITGQLCAEGAVSNNHITMPRAAAGMYLLTISNEAGNTETQKIMIR